MQQVLFDYISKYIDLTEDEKNVLVDLDVFRTAKKGEILLREGEKTNNTFFVIKGCIRTYYLIDGEEKTTAFSTELEGVTPHCVIDKSPSRYYVSAVEDSIITVGSSDMEEEMFERFPKFEIMCKKVSEELLAKRHLDLDEFKILSPEQRYLSLLEKRPDLIQRVPQHQLASFLGVTPQSLSRMRARINKKN